MTYLSPHFTLAEMTVTQVRRADNAPSMSQMANLIRLCDHILEPLRNKVGGPVIVTSGYRSPEVNEIVGGSSKSAHCHGLAADIIVPGKSPLQVCKIIAMLDLPYEQLIQEFGRWTHVSIPAAKTPPKRAHLTASIGAEGKTFYVKGLS